MAVIVNKAEEKTAIELLASGTTQTEVAEVLGKDQSSISRFARKNQEAIEKETEKLIKVLPSIMEQTIRDIDTANKVSRVLAGEAKMTELPIITRDPDLLLKIANLAYKKQSDILRALGVFPATSQSIFIQNLIQRNTTNVFSPTVMQMMGKYIQEALEEPVIDAEVVDAGKDKKD